MSNPDSADFVRNFIKRVIAEHEEDFNIQYEDKLPALDFNVVRTDESLAKLFNRALFFQSSMAYVLWQPFLENYAPEITQSDKAYLSTVMHICRRVSQGTVKLPERLLRIFAAVCGAARFYWTRFKKSYFKYTVPVLTVYLESEFSDAFLKDVTTRRELEEFLSIQFYIEYSNKNTRKDPEKHSDRFKSELARYVSKTPYLNDVQYIVLQDVLNDKQSLELGEKVIDFFVREEAKYCWSNNADSYDDINMIVLDDTRFNQVPPDCEEPKKDPPADLDSSDSSEVSFELSGDVRIPVEPLSKANREVQIINEARIFLHYAGVYAEGGKFKAQELARSARQSALSEEEPALSAQQSALSEEEPALIAQELALSDQQSALSEEEPALIAQELALSDQQTALSEEEPTPTAQELAKSK